jgi:hypothetical protein
MGVTRAGMACACPRLSPGRPLVTGTVPAALGRQSHLLRPPSPVMLMLGSDAALASVKLLSSCLTHKCSYPSCAAWHWPCLAVPSAVQQPPRSTAQHSAVQPWSAVMSAFSGQQWLNDMSMGVTFYPVSLPYARVSDPACQQLCVTCTCLWSKNIVMSMCFHRQHSYGSTLRLSFSPTPGCARPLAVLVVDRLHLSMCDAQSQRQPHVSSFQSTPQHSTPVFCATHALVSAPPWLLFRRRGGCNGELHFTLLSDRDDLLS